MLWYAVQDACWFGLRAVRHSEFHRGWLCATHSNTFYVCRQPATLFTTIATLPAATIALTTAAIDLTAATPSLTAATIALPAAGHQPAYSSAYPAYSYVPGQSHHVHYAGFAACARLDQRRDQFGGAI